MIGQLAKRFFEASPVLDLAVVALVLFLLVFSMLFIRTYVTGAEHHKRLSQLPLASDERRGGADE